MPKPFNVDLSKFKKIAEDQDKTTLEHADGHQIIVAHKALPKHIKEQFSRLPVSLSPQDNDNDRIPMMADGGKLNTSDRKHIAAKNFAGPDRSYPIEDASHARNALSRVSQFGDSKLKAEVRSKVHAKYPDIGKADGGHISMMKPIAQKQSNPKLEESKKEPRYAKGGRIPDDYVKKGSPVSDDDIIKDKEDTDAQNKENEMNGVDQQPYSPEVEKRMQETDVTPKQYADGSQDQPVAQNDSAPVSTLPGNTPQPATEQQLNQTADKIDATSGAIGVGDLPSDQDTPVAPNTLAGIGNSPDYQKGYQNTVAGTKKEALAESNAALQNNATMNDAADIQLHQMNSVQSKMQQLNQSRVELQNELNNPDSDIKPHSMWDGKDTFQKVSTGIGLILGGIGGGLTHSPNAAMQFLNQQIDRDLEAQKANLGKKQSLLSANLATMGNLTDASTMTRLQMQDWIQSQLAATAAKSNSQTVQARAQQHIGQFQMEQAMPTQQMAIRQTMMDQMWGQMNQQANAQPGQQPQKSQLDPAMMVTMAPIPIKDDQQKAVADEIKRAQDTRAITNPILNEYDKVVNSYQAGGGLGRIPNVIRENRDLQSLRGLVNTTVTDLTGTARQAEFDSVANNMLPKPGDTDSELANKRNAFVQYLNAKSSAPLAKSHGIDLEKFQNTAQVPNNSPQQSQSSTQDGQRGMSKSGKPIIMKNGQWVYE